MAFFEVRDEPGLHGMLSSGSWDRVRDAVCRSKRRARTSRTAICLLAGAGSQRQLQVPVTQRNAGQQADDSASRRIGRDLASVQNEHYDSDCRPGNS
jgi:hypothetical protein